jgi:single-stranded-DNA-specific exonuclease
MEKRWVLASSCNDATVNEISDQLNIDRALAQILVQRNICSFEEARNFFRPELTHLHDPFLMKDMDKAIDRVENADWFRLTNRLLIAHRWFFPWAMAGAATRPG